MAHSLLIRDIHTLATMDGADRVLHGAFIYTEGGQIRRIGSGAERPPHADQVIRGATRW